MDILIVKTSSLGDIVQAMGVAQYLRQYSPSCQITWVVEAPHAPLVDALPDIDHLLIVDTKQWRHHPLSRDTWNAIHNNFQQLRSTPYDIVLDLQGNTKSALITACSKGYSKIGFDYPYIAEWPALLPTKRRFLPKKERNIRDDYLALASFALNTPPTSHKELAPVTLKKTPKQREKVDTLLSRLSTTLPPNTLPILLFAGSAWKNKQLNEQTLTLFLQKITRHFPFQLWIGWGSPTEREQAARLHKSIKGSQLLPHLELPELHHLMDLTYLTLSMDSLPLHLAATTRCSTFSFFGPSLATKYAPEGPKHGHYQGICPYGQTFTKRCPKLRSCPHGNCLQSTSEEELLSHFHRWQGLCPCTPPRDTSLGTHSR